MSNISKILREKELDYSNYVYCFAYLIIVLKAFYAYSEIITSIRMQIVLNISNLAFILILAYKILFLQKYSVKQAIALVLLGAISLYTDRTLSMFQMLPDFLLIAAMQDVDFKRTIKIVYRIEAAIILIHVAVYPVVFVFNRQAIRFSIRGGELDKLRHQFLLSHANIFSMILLWTILAYLYVNCEKVSRKSVVLLWFTYVAFYMFTKSNSGLIILTAVTILLLLKKTFGNLIDGVVNFLSRYLFIILIILSVFMMFILPYLSGAARDAWLAVDAFFTGRLKYGAFAFNKAGLTLLGQKIYFSGREYWAGMWFDALACDNAYMWISVSYGFIYLLIIGYLFWRYTPRAKFEDKIMFIAYSLYTLMELYVVYLFFCFAVIIVGQYLWKDYSDNKLRISKGNGGE